MDRAAISPSLAASRSFFSRRLVSLVSAAAHITQRALRTRAAEPQHQQQLKPRHTLQHGYDFIIHCDIFWDLSHSIDYAATGIVPQQQQDDLLEKEKMTNHSQSIGENGKYLVASVKAKPNPDSHQ